MTNTDARVARLELRIMAQDRTIAQLLGRLIDLEQRSRVAQSGGASAGDGGGGGFGVAVGAIAADAVGYVQPCEPADGWAYVGDPVTVLNPDPTASIASGKRCAYQQAGSVKLVSPLQC